MSYASYDIKCHIMMNEAYDIEIWHSSIGSTLVSKRPSGPQSSHLSHMSEVVSHVRDEPRVLAPSQSHPAEQRPQPAGAISPPAVPATRKNCSNMWCQNIKTPDPFSLQGREGITWHHTFHCYSSSRGCVLPTLMVSVHTRPNCSILSQPPRWSEFHTEYSIVNH